MPIELYEESPCESPSTVTKCEMKQAVSPYVVSFQVGPFHNGKRYHWMICRTESPDKLVSWGHGCTQAMAEKAARDELDNLASGKTQGGPVASKSAPPLPPQRRP